MKLRPFKGDIISPEKLRSPRSQSVYRYLKSSHSLYFQLLECRAYEEFDILVVQVSVEVYQRRSIDIRSKEIVAITFRYDRDSQPWFFPLRLDFPVDLVHVMVDWEIECPSLCLWDEPFEDLRSRLTPHLLLLRLKEWLEKSADGTLHHGDQPLEPVLLGYRGQIIIPLDISEPGKKYIAFHSYDAYGQITISFDEVNNFGRKEKPDFVLVPFTTSPITHRAVRYAPRNLEQLHNLLCEVGFDIKKELKAWVQQVGQDEVLVKARPVILIEFPKRRTEKDAIESTESWAFITGSSITELGEALGAFAYVGADIQSFGILIDGDANTSVTQLEKFQTDTLAVRRALSAEKLSILSGYGEQTAAFIVAIGAGALGSKIVELSARCGFGRWSIIDKDILLPHNLVRHVLGDFYVGMPKADALQDFVNTLVPGLPVCKAIVADVTHPDTIQEIEDIFSDADLILDMSASVSVSRYLCEYATNKRVASLFLSPNGKDIVLLMGDVEGKISLWDLESIYYKALVSDGALQGHLTDDKSSVRYGNGCRDLTARISADQLSTLAGIALRQLIKRSKNSGGSATVWRSDLESGEVKVVDLLVSPGIETKLSDWRVRWNKGVLDELFTQRLENLPNETGGVLLGVVDFEHKIVVVSAQIPAPPDSVKRPHYFERGITGLNNRLEEMVHRSAGQLKYLGEWHSHPNNIAARPSKDDENVFAKLKEIFDEINELYIMSILGNNEIFMRIGLNSNVEEISIPLLNKI